MLPEINLLSESYDEKLKEVKMASLEKRRQKKRNMESIE